jgi:hypothetical protein
MFPVFNVSSASRALENVKKKEAKAKFRFTNWLLFHRAQFTGAEDIGVNQYTTGFHFTGATISGASSVAPIVLACENQPLDQDYDLGAVRLTQRQLSSVEF